jgi:hypothetical protein
MIDERKPFAADEECNQFLTEKVLSLYRPLHDKGSSKSDIRRNIRF